MCGKRIYFLILFLFILFSKNIFAQQDSAFTVKYFSTLPNISIRALEAVSETSVWFAANNGVWGYTGDAGKSWHIDSIKVDSVYPQFRSMAVLNDSTVLLLSIETPAYLFKTTNKGKSWRLVYKNTNKNIFFDCMKFYNEKEGFALGDPINGCFQLIKTEDAGETWTQADCAVIPKADSGEACFAASNSNIATIGNIVWFVSGGKRARVFRSYDMGKHFEAWISPLPKGGKLTGIFSVDFSNELIGIIAGGNYEKSDSSVISLAKTFDGGMHWSIFKSKKPLFGSCVKFRNQQEFYVTGGEGTFICNFISGKITEVKGKSGAALKFNILRFSPDKKALWLAGNKGAIALITLVK